MYVLNLAHHYQCLIVEFVLYTTTTSLNLKDTGDGA